jgi:hypothetical protein
MAFRWTLSEQEELVHVVAEGSVDLTAVVETIFEVIGSPKFTARWCVLVDLTEMEYQPWVIEVVEIARALRNAGPMLGRRTAIVAGGKVFELVEMVASMSSADGRTIRAFSDPLAARAWLLSAEPKP